MKRLTYQSVRDSFEKERYELLSKEYKNSKTKLEYICPKGHQNSIIYNSWYCGARCPTCSLNKKLTFEEVRTVFEKELYILLDKKYVNARTILKCLCSKGHEHSISYDNFKKGYRCPICANIMMSGSGNPNWKGGISFEPYCEAWKDQEYKKDIRSRDGNRCLNPYCSSPDKNDLTIHHIDYDKKNCKPTNLVTVCRSCNSKANTDRDWHKAWYQAILIKRYNYDY